MAGPRMSGWIGTLVLAVVISRPNRVEAKVPQLFLSVKGANVSSWNLQDVSSAYVIVTDTLVSPEGQPLSLLGRELNGSKFNGLNKLGSGVKLLASFGGSAVPSELFSHLVEDSTRRAKFVRNAIRFVTRNEFSGVDIAWLYPTDADKESYGNLLNELRTACDRKKLILTVTVPSHPSVIGRNYPTKELENVANYVILCTNEFRKLKKTSLVAPLYSVKERSSNSVDSHINAWKKAGISGDKLVMVIQTNSLTYKLPQPNEYRLGTPALKLKIRPFYKICQKLYSGSLEVFEETARCPYAFREKNWYSYENSKSIQEKVEYAVSQSLGGVGVFHYDDDDPFDVCGDGSHPVTRAVVASLVASHRPRGVASIAQRSIANSDLEAFEDSANLRIVDSGINGAQGEDHLINDNDGFSFEDLESYVMQPFRPHMEPSKRPTKPSMPTKPTTTTKPSTKSCRDCGYYINPSDDEDDDDIEDFIPFIVDTSDSSERPAVILSNSDDAFAAYNCPASGANANILFSESSAGPVNSGPLFSETEPAVRIKPVPKSAQYDPQRSRIGIIATGSVGSAVNRLPIQQPLSNIVATGLFQNTASTAQLNSDMNSIPYMMSNNNGQTGFAVCPYDGIIPDPRNPRYYYLCRQGLPLNDENRFACADGYVFNPISLKCTPLV
ncbi:endochitinase-like [Wyeomyia smithii]|uniref:endochitinase-like n=1 Tax=Wyeomyia smithii TaxID=174621 RepID=UPI002467CBB6|nr:endochitinase-like [Wyeomyia smithii]